MCVGVSRILEIYMYVNVCVYVCVCVCRASETPDKVDHAAGAEAAGMTLQENLAAGAKDPADGFKPAAAATGLASHLASLPREKVARIQKEVDLALRALRELEEGSSAQSPLSENSKHIARTTLTRLTTPPAPEPQRTQPDPNTSVEQLAPWKTAVAILENFDKLEKFKKSAPPISEVLTIHGISHSPDETTYSQRILVSIWLVAGGNNWACSEIDCFEAQEHQLLHTWLTFLQDTDVDHYAQAAHYMGVPCTPCRRMFKQQLLEPQNPETHADAAPSRRYVKARRSKALRHNKTVVAPPMIAPSIEDAPGPSPPLQSLSNSSP